MTHDAPFLHFFQSLANQCVLVGVQLDVVGDRLVDEIAARTLLRGGQRIKRLDLLHYGTEADGFLLAPHNARTITHIILYYNVSIRDNPRFWRPPLIKRATLRMYKKVSKGNRPGRACRPEVRRGRL